MIEFERLLPDDGILAIDLCPTRGPRDHVESAALPDRVAAPPFTIAHDLERCQQLRVGPGSAIQPDRQHHERHAHGHQQGDDRRHGSRG